MSSASPSNSSTGSKRGQPVPPLTLSIDVGGSSIKAGMVNGRGRPVGVRVSMPTPPKLDPSKLLEAITGLVTPMANFDRVAVGINGLVYRGVVYAIPITNNPRFHRFQLARELTARWHRPVRVVNDAQLHGLGVIRGRGVELVITLGTGLGTALFIDRVPGPQPQITPPPECNEPPGGSYGDAALALLGRRRWNRRVEALIPVLRRLTNFDHLYVGGGNADKLVVRLPRHVSIFDSTHALKGGFRVWQWNQRVRPDETLS